VAVRLIRLPFAAAPRWGTREGRSPSRSRLMAARVETSCQRSVRHRVAPQSGPCCVTRICVVVGGAHRPGTEAVHAQCLGDRQVAGWRDITSRRFRYRGGVCAANVQSGCRPACVPIQRSTDAAVPHALYAEQRSGAGARRKLWIVHGRRSRAARISALSPTNQKVSGIGRRGAGV